MAEHTQTRLCTVNVFAPPQRMVMITVYKPLDAYSFRHDVHPVLGVEVRTYEEWKKSNWTAPTPPPRQPSTEEFERDGWEFVGVRVEYGVVFLTDSVESTLSSWTKFFEGFHKLKCIPVVCTWPESDDKERLRPTIEKALHEARANDDEAGRHEDTGILQQTIQELDAAKKVKERASFFRRWFGL